MRVKRTNRNTLYGKLWKGVVVFLAILGAVSAVVTIVGFLKEDKTEVTYEIARELDVLNLNKDVKGLEILFRKEDIVKKELSLKLLLIKVVNTGDTHIKEGDFDTSNQWKFKVIDNQEFSIKGINNEDIDNKVVSSKDVNGGGIDSKIVSSKKIDGEDVDNKIVGVNLESTSDRNIKKNLKKINISEKYFELPFFMFDKGDYFTLEVIILHKKNTPVKLVMDGKISGMDEFTLVTNTSKKKSKLSKFLMVAFQGGVGTHLARLAVYVLGLFIVILLSVLSSVYFEKRKTDQIRRSREESVNQYFSDITNKPGGETIASVYLSGGDEALKKLRDNLSQDILHFSASAFKVEIDYRRQIEGTKGRSDLIFINPNLSDSFGSALKSLMEKSLIKQKDDSWVLDEDFRSLLNESIKRLSSNA